MTVRPPAPGLEWAFSVDAELGPLQDHGMTRVGHRRIIPIAGGTVTGAFTGVLLPGGADWQTVRADGSIEIDGRYSACADDGALLYVTARGVRSGDPGVLQSLLDGADVDPSAYYFRTALTLECATDRSLEDAVFVASCVREADRVRYDAYRVS
ncbi:hypothetical protein CVS47_00269 [Microbacterium lemovicicum]|uniref:UPF0311 protein CVS47_00269 n=1 Tax=Microbacterium lemovicicum TaxID=1072463 RepID=A0A3S9W6P2_9MICO|nr:DUF3237 domain-containing protein [Microbacterium lemovicicum]AZS35674.1 hypothetical protein CVS47_00269 [Microbacterium lemovicicum]